MEFLIPLDQSLNLVDQTSLLLFSIILADITYDILTKLKNICSDDIVGSRNKLLLQLGYETMRRRSEICRFKFEDLQHLGNNKRALLLQHSKTDQYNQGKIIPISVELSEMIENW